MSIYLLLSRVKSNLYSFKVLQISNVVVTKIRIVLLTYWSHRGPYEWGRGWDAYWTGGHRPRHHHGNSVHSRSAGEVASSLGWLVRTDCPCERKTGFRWIGQRKNIQRTKKITSWGYTYKQKNTAYYVTPFADSTRFCQTIINFLLVINTLNFQKMLKKKNHFMRINFQDRNKEISVCVLSHLSPVHSWM